MDSDFVYLLCVYNTASKALHFAWNHSVIV